MGEGLGGIIIAEIDPIDGPGRILSKIAKAEAHISGAAHRIQAEAIGITDTVDLPGGAIAEKEFEGIDIQTAGPIFGVEQYGIESGLGIRMIGGVPITTPLQGGAIAKV